MPRLFVGLLNAFVALLCLDGALSLLGRGLEALLGVDLLGAVHGLTGLAVVVAAPWVVLALALCSRVPASAFVPGLIVVWWAALGCMPLLVHWPLGVTLALAASLELLAGLWAYARLRQLTGAGWVSEAVLAPGWWRAGYSVAVLGGALVLVPIVTVGWLLWSIAYGVEVTTAGFVRLDANGVQMLQRTYTRDGREVRLLGMMHIGEEEVYEELLREFPVQGSIVLAEGVRGEEAEAAGLDYGGTARRLGLVMQGPMDALSEIPVRNADVSADQFSPLTLRLVANAAVFHGDAPLTAKLAAYAELTELIQGHEGDPLAVLLHDVVDLRNAHLLGVIDEVEGQYERLIVPWGAYHLKGIEQGLLERGYQPGAERFTTFARWSTVRSALGW
jgi:hypothetical protein